MQTSDAKLEYSINGGTYSMTMPTITSIIFHIKGRDFMDINNLTENVLRRMPANLTQIEQARYIYLQLGKLFTFDEKYWLGNSKTRRMIYRSARKKYKLLKI